jgi:aminoglycoside phosphotransferase
MMAPETRTQILTGESGCTVVRVRTEDGLQWIEKTGPAPELAKETAVLEWCAGLLPVPQVLRKDDGFLAMSVLPGVSLTEASAECAVTCIVDALRAVHAIPIDACPFAAGWAARVNEGAARVRAGLVDESDFDVENLGRSAADIVDELRSMAPLPGLVCFTHGDACLENFLTDNGRLSGVIDVGRAGVTHPAQDWALALRSVRGHFGTAGEQLLRTHLPECCADEELLRRFRLLDELF